MTLLLAILFQAAEPLQVARQAIFEGRLDEAESRLEEILSRDPPRVFEVHFSLGRVYLQKRDYVAAKEAFTQSLARAPRFGPALLGRARASLFISEIEDGLADLRAAQSIPSPPDEARILEAQLDLYLSQSEPDSEIELERALGEDLGNADLYLALGVRYLRMKQTEKAQKALRVARSIEDQNPVSFLLLGDDAFSPPPYPELAFDLQTARAALSSGDFEAASAEARKILSKRPLFVPARLLLLRVAETRGDTLDQLLLYQDLVEQIPDLPALLTQVARLAQRAGAFELAECSARRALASSPADPAGVYLLLATAQLSAEKPEKALETCRRATAEGFETAPIYFTLGEVHHARMELSESISAFEKAVALDPQAAENIAAFALSSLTTEQYASLRSLLENHVASHPDNVNTLYGLGVMYLRDGELERARACFDRLRTLAPRKAQVYYNLALIDQREGRPDEAGKAMERFDALREEEERLWREGRRIHDRRLEGKDALEERDFAKAIEVFGELTESSAHEAGDFVSLGDGLLGAGRPEEAGAAFEKALKEAPHSKEALSGMARALDSLGKKEEAERYRRAAALLERKCP
jgi:tetratricopeptide (TPR) repeat protein